MYNSRVYCLYKCYTVVQIILGSSSVARRKILAEMGYEFTIMVRFSRIFISHRRHCINFAYTFSLQI